MTAHADMSLFARPRIAMQEREDGCLLLRSADPLQDYPGTVVHSLWAWAAADPDHPLVAQRGADGSWRASSYGAAVAAAAAIGQALLELGLARDRPLLVLSGNSIDHLLVTLGAMTAGVPVAPVSVAYSLQSRDHARIRAITELIDPGAVFAEDAERFGPALDALGQVPAIISTGSRAGAVRLAELTASRPGQLVASAFAALRGRRDREDPFHVRLDRRAERGAEHPPDAGGQSADDAPGMAVPRRRAAGDRGLAAVESYLRR